MGWWLPVVGRRRVAAVSCVEKARLSRSPWDEQSLNRARPGVVAKASPLFQVQVVDYAVFHLILVGAVQMFVSVAKVE